MEDPVRASDARDDVAVVRRALCNATAVSERLVRALGPSADCMAYVLGMMSDVSTTLLTTRLTVSTSVVEDARSGVALSRLPGCTVSVAKTATNNDEA